MDSRIQYTSRWKYNGLVTERGIMKINSYFKNEKFTKIVMGVLLFLIIMLVGGISVLRAEDNKTIEFTDRGWPKLLDDDKWTSQLIFDTVQACYQGTIRWVVLSHPTLLNQIPTLAAQRQMMEHCFCVMDKIRKENKVKEYKKRFLIQNGEEIFLC